MAYNCLKLSMSVATVSGCNLILRASVRSQVLHHLFAGMSNVWKRYLFANPVTYIMLSILAIVHYVVTSSNTVRVSYNAFHSYIWFECTATSLYVLRATVKYNQFENRLELVFSL